MRKHILIFPLAMLVATPAMAAPWVRGFAADNYEPAFRFGSSGLTQTDPGSDCPQGAIKEMNYRQILKTTWRTQAEVDHMTGPAHDTFDPRAASQDAMAHRGYAKNIDTYVNPFTAPDPGFQEVTGKIAEGFNLDGDAKTGGFTGVNGERGVDNAFYRVLGCTLSFRARPYHAYLSMRANDKVLDGLYTMVVRVSGNKDPMNDDNATVEIAYSPDHMIKDAAGKVVHDYSFRVAKSAEYTKLKAHIKNGVVETDQVDELKAPAFAWYESNRGEATFKKGKIRLVIHPDGSVDGLIGGYRDWRTLYGNDTFNVPSGGESRETTYFQNQIGIYYALKRNADAYPDPKTGQNTQISTAYRFTMVPAYVVDPATPAVISNPQINNRAALQRIAFIKGVTTHTPVLDAPRKGRKPVTDEDGVIQDEAPAPKQKAPGGKSLQVDNAAPATVASNTPAH